MNNKSHLGFIENEINGQKKNGGYFPADMGVSYSSDIQRLLQNIIKRNPELMNIGGDIDVEPDKLPLITKKNLTEYLKQSRKGAVCFFKDEKGLVRIMVNAGQGYGSNKNRVLFFPESLKKESPENFKKILHRALIQQDIEHVYRRIRKQRQMQNPRPALYSTKKSIDAASSGFEKKFKTMIREQGGAINPMRAAQLLVASMPGKDRTNLNSAFRKMNIKNGVELEGLLAQWKYEALGHAHSLTAARKQEKDIGREMA